MIRHDSPQTAQLPLVKLRFPPRVLWKRRNRPCLASPLKQSASGVPTQAPPTQTANARRAVFDRPNQAWAIIQVTPEVLPIHLEALLQEDIPQLSEAMLTSSGRGIVPITAINGIPVGNGVVGPIITALRRAFETWTDAHIEPI